MSENALCFFDSDHRALLLPKTCPVDGGPKPFCFQHYWFEEKVLMDSLKGWWESLSADGNAGFVFHSKLTQLKGMIKTWVKNNLGRLENHISHLEGILQDFELNEEDILLLEAESEEKQKVKLALCKTLNSEDLFWLRETREKWKLNGDRLQAFFTSW